MAHMTEQDRLERNKETVMAFYDLMYARSADETRPPMRRAGSGLHSSVSYNAIVEVWIGTLRVLAVIVGLAIAWFFVVFTPLGYITWLGGAIPLVSTLILGIAFSWLIVGLVRRLADAVRPRP